MSDANFSCGNKDYYYINPKLKQIKIDPIKAVLYIENSVHQLVPFCRINHSAFDILTACNGKRSISEIILELCKTYNESNVSTYVENYIYDCLKKEILLVKQEPIDTTISIIGSKNKWALDLVTIEMTTCCPLNCKHCYKDASPNKKNSLDTKQLEIIESYIYDNNIELVQITGGEPFNHPLFFPFINKLISHKVRVFVSTSGYVKDTDFIKSFLELDKKMVSVQVSIDGPEKFHNTFRGKDDAFKVSMEFIKLIKNARFNTIVALTLSSQKEEELFEITDILKTEGVRILRIGGILNEGRATHNKKTLQIWNQADIVNLRNKLSAAFADEKFRIEIIEEKKDDNISVNCGLCQSMIKVDETGTYSPCLLSDIKLGNIYDHTLDNILETFSGHFFDIIPPCRNVCKNCDHIKKCNGCIVAGLIYGEKKCTWYMHNEHIFSLIEEKSLC